MRNVASSVEWCSAISQNGQKIWQFQSQINSLALTHTLQDSWISKFVQCTSLLFQSIHYAHSLSLGVFSVCYCISYDIFQKYFQNRKSDHSLDRFHTTTWSCKPPNRWLSDGLDVVARHLSVPLVSSFLKPFTTFSTSNLDCLACVEHRQN